MGRCHAVVLLLIGLRAAVTDAAPPDASFPPALHSPTDTASGLPTRVLHQATGIELALIPAGEFQMGSPATEADRREYAARAGTRERYPWGNAEAGGKGFANVGDKSRRRRFPSTNVFFPFDDGAGILSPVARYKPNAWGLYDMIGNVEEWCQDAAGPYPPDGSDELPAGGDAAGARVLRGGAWTGNAGTSRFATRIGMAPTSRRDFQGFRVAAAIP